MENRPEIALQHRGFSRPCNTGRGTRRVGDATSGTAALIHTCADRLNEAGRQRAAGIPERRVAPSVAPRGLRDAHSPRLSRSNPAHGAAKESNLPTVGLPRPAGFEDRMGHQTPAAPQVILRTEQLVERLAGVAHLEGA